MKIETTESEVYKGIKKLRESGAEVYTNGMGGKVSVQGVKADYYFDKDINILSIKITDKPWLVSLDYVEQKIKEYFN